MSKTPTPRTDAESLSGQGKAGRCYVSVNFARQLETELAKAKEQLEQSNNPIHSCGSHCKRPACLLRRELAAKTAELEEAKRQMDSWLKEHDSIIRTARANAFDEAADIAFNNSDYPTARHISAKANRIRKGEEK